MPCHPAFTAFLCPTSFVNFKHPYIVFLSTPKYRPSELLKGVYWQNQYINTFCGYFLPLLLSWNIYYANKQINKNRRGGSAGTYHHSTTTTTDRWREESLQQKLLFPEDHKREKRGERERQSVERKTQFTPFGKLNAASHYSLSLSLSLSPVSCTVATTTATTVTFFLFCLPASLQGQQQGLFSSFLPNQRERERKRRSPPAQKGTRNAKVPPTSDCTVYCTAEQFSSVLYSVPLNVFTLCDSLVTLPSNHLRTLKTNTRVPSFKNLLNHIAFHGTVI